MELFEPFFFATLGIICATFVPVFVMVFLSAIVSLFKD